MKYVSSLKQCRSRKLEMSADAARVPKPQVVHMIQNCIALTADPEGQEARASMRISEQTQGLLDAVWDQLTKI